MHVQCGMAVGDEPPIIDVTQPRGDSVTWVIGVMVEEDGVTKHRPFREGDVVVFAIKSAPTSDVWLVEKRVTEFRADGNADIVINPEDTKDLPGGVLYYGAKLQAVDVGGKTFISPSSKYKLTPSV